MAAIGVVIFTTFVYLFAVMCSLQNYLHIDINIIIIPTEKRVHRKRCGACTGCKAEKCGECINCIKPERNTVCVKRRCLNLQ